MAQTNISTMNEIDNYDLVHTTKDIIAVPKDGLNIPKVYNKTTEQWDTTNWRDPRVVTAVHTIDLMNYNLKMDHTSFIEEEEARNG